MYCPVRRCQKNELSLSCLMPTHQPASTNSALNASSRPGTRPDRAGSARPESESEAAARSTSPFDARRTAASSVAIGGAMVGLGSADVLADRDEGRPEHHDEHRGEDAQHEREQHL